jgi:hydroxymethylglutaryl-CoA lyase
MNHVKVVECPRDAWQGLSRFIPTEAKIAHLKQLYSVGFDTIDAGSFVSKKAMPQMADAEDLFRGIESTAKESATKTLSIIANLKGAQRAIQFEFINSWGYPFSVSEEFQRRNSRMELKASMEDLLRIKELALKSNTELVVYLSMGFGNPYGEAYSLEILHERLEQAINCGADIVSLSDTTGQGDTASIEVLANWMKDYCNVPWGMHLHSTYERAAEKALTAFRNGVQRLDTALKGFGGCPMAADHLVGNMPTEKVLSVLEANNISHNLNPLQIESSYNSALSVFEKQS